MAKKTIIEAPPMGELTDTIHIDVTAIPKNIQNNLAAATLDFIRGLLQEPGGRERLEAKKAALQAKESYGK